MASIKIAGKKFKLASRLTRLYALFIDIAILGAAQSVIVSLVAFAAFLFLPTGPSDVPWSLASGVGLSLFASVFSAALWIFGLFFMDGFRKGQGIGKKLLSLQVLRLEGWQAVYI